MGRGGLIFQMQNMQEERDDQFHARVSSPGKKKKITERMSDYLLDDLLLKILKIKEILEQDTGVGPASSAWEADILPMY